MSGNLSAGRESDPPMSGLDPVNLSKRATCTISLPNYFSDMPRNWCITVCIGQIGCVSDVHHRALDDSTAPIKYSTDSTTGQRFQ
jgi:hypothetical protein